MTFCVNKQAKAGKVNLLIFALLLCNIDVIAVALSQNYSRHLSHGRAERRERGAGHKYSGISDGKRGQATVAAASSATLEPSVTAIALREVWRRLLAAVEPQDRPRQFPWPPVLIGPDQEEINRFNTMIAAAKTPEWAIGETEMNAYTSFLPRSTLVEFQFLSQAADAATNKQREIPIPFIVVAPALTERLLKNPAGTLNYDRAGFLLGHELAHILKSHVHVNPGISVEGFSTSRTQEFEADLKGMELALAADFSKDNGLKLYQALEDESDYSSIEGQRQTHPSHKERLAELDKKQRQLWRAMVEFDNGVFLLSVEQYDAAINSFRGVLKEFPESYESWSNLGYAELMKYCDALDAVDLAILDLSPLVVGAFYDRPESLRSRIKGFDDELWNKSVSSLQRALVEAEKTGANTSLIKANLGVAFLVKSKRTEADLTRARAFFGEALSVAGRVDEVSISRIAVLLNASVADLAAKKPEEALRKLDAVRKHNWWGSTRRADFNSPYQQLGATLMSAECFSRGLAMMSMARTSDDGAEAVEGICRCMIGSPAASYWQQVILRRLPQLGGAATAPGCVSVAPATLRMVVSARVLPGVDVDLGEEMEAVALKLAAAGVVYDAAGRELKRLDVPTSGFEVLGDRAVIAIVLKDEKALPVKLRNRTPGGPVRELSVGMRQAQVERLLGRAHAGTIFTADAPKDYRFYPYVGLAVKYNARGTVMKLVVVQAPRRG